MAITYKRLAYEQFDGAWSDSSPEVSLQISDMAPACGALADLWLDRLAHLCLRISWCCNSTNGMPDPRTAWFLK
jgi:hypothetical protein